MKSIVLGIPTWNESRTVQHVLRTVDEGAALLPSDVEVTIVVADNSSTDGTPEIVAGTSTQHKTIIVSTEHKGGKGLNVLAILQKAYASNACVALFDADVRTVEPSWVPSLAMPILRGEVEFVTPIYRRNRFEGNTTNHVVFPVLYGIFGQVVRQPIAGEFAIGQSLVERVLSHPVPESARQYGIDVLLTTSALLAKLPIGDVTLGRKIHNPGFPKIVDMSRQVTHSMLFSLKSGGLLDLQGKARMLPSSKEDHSVLFSTISPSVDERLSPPDPILVAETVNTTKSLLHDHYGLCQKLAPHACVESPIGEDSPLPLLTADTWPIVLANLLDMAGRGYDLWELSRAFVPLYLCRVFSYWVEIGSLSEPEIDNLLALQALSLRAVLRDKQLHDT